MSESKVRSSQQFHNVEFPVRDPKYRIYEVRNNYDLTLFFVMKKGWIFWRNLHPSKFAYTSFEDAERAVELERKKLKTYKPRLVKEYN
jgi:hypothetical protein